MLTVPLVDYARAPVPVPTPSPFRCEASVKALTRASRFDCFDRRRRVFVRARSSRSQDISHIFIEKQKENGPPIFLSIPRLLSRGRGR